MPLGTTPEAVVLSSWHMTASTELGERVRQLRSYFEWTQGDLTDALNGRGVKVNQSHVSKIENGQRFPSFDVLRGLVQTLQTNADYLLGLTENPLSIVDIETRDNEVLDLLTRLTPVQRAQATAFVEFLLLRDEVAALGGVMTAIENRTDPATFRAILAEIARNYPNVFGDELGRRRTG